MTTAEELEIRLALRDLCRQYGDNDWPDDLHPVDAIEKHLVRPMAERLDGRERTIKVLTAEVRQLRRTIAGMLHR